MSTQSIVDQFIEKLLSWNPDVELEMDDSETTLDSVGTLGRTPLMVVASEGLTCVCEMLLSKGACVNASGDGMMTALHEASANGHSHIARRLLELGAEVDAETIDRVTPLMCAAAWGHTETVALLIMNGADCLKTDRTGATAFDIAREKGEDEVSEMLLLQMKGNKSP